MSRVDVWELPKDEEIDPSSIGNTGAPLQMSDFVCIKCGTAKEHPSFSGPWPCMSCPGHAIENKDSRRYITKKLSK